MMNSVRAFVAVSILSIAFTIAHGQKMPVIFDTDANNELDDQHALAYLLFNSNDFDVKGITVNATKSGGNIDAQYAEALRVIKLCGKEKAVALFKGANANFTDILPTLKQAGFDGAKAVDFIISQAKTVKNQKLLVIAVGKLTNVALAIAKDPSIVPAIKVVWLGSNYPDPGEYNMVNDTASMNYVLQTPTEFELVPACYGKTTGTDFVKVTKQDIDSVMPGLGPKVLPVEGRHGGTFTCFGDYSLSLFEHIDYYGDPPSRALFDMAAVSVVKNPSFAKQKSVPCPALIDGSWVEQPENKHFITIWYNFDKQAILDDFFTNMKSAH